MTIFLHGDCTTRDVLYYSSLCLFDLSKSSVEVQRSRLCTSLLIVIVGSGSGGGGGLTVFFLYIEVGELLLLFYCDDVGVNVVVTVITTVAIMSVSRSLLLVSPVSLLLSPSRHYSSRVSCGPLSVRGGVNLWFGELVHNCRGRR